MALRDNIVAYYKLDGNSNDSVGTNNGTDTAITYSVANGKINQGAGYNGSTSKITISDASVLKPATNFSINLWIYPTSFALNFIGLFDKYVGSTSGYAIDIQSSANKLPRFLIYNGANTNIIATTALAINTWYMITATYDGANAKIYVNGILEATTSTSGSVVTGTDNPTIGGDGVSTNLFTGNIDEVGFWNKPLISSEISQLYNGGKGLQYPFNTGAFFQFFN